MKPRVTWSSTRSTRCCFCLRFRQPINNIILRWHARYLDSFTRRCCLPVLPIILRILFPVPLQNYYWITYAFTYSYHTQSTSVILCVICQCNYFISMNLIRSGGYSKNISNRSTYKPNRLILPSAPFSFFFNRHYAHYAY